MTGGERARRTHVVVERGEAHVRAERCFGEDEPAFSGHFPTFKILPGVMLIELALDVARDYVRARAGARPLARLASAQFVAPVWPGQKVHCHCEFRADGDRLNMRAVLTRADVVCATVRAVYAPRAAS